MFTLIAQLASPASDHGFWRSPSVYTLADITVTVLLVFGVLLLWVRFTRWRNATAPLFTQVGVVMGDLAGVKGELANLKHDMVGVRHDINAVGETVATLGEQLGADIVMSEERIVAKLGEVADAQIVLMQTLSARPCVVREVEARECTEPEKGK